ncbi:MAG: hypothetical protein MJZ93_07225 [Paludibacteraceae bacterium]|nr:hypothetical protein [Paludibacteraceae bacterium]
MKTKIFLMFMVALPLAACHNVNPPSDEISDKVIDACHDAIGQPYSAFADRMSELGIELIIGDNQRGDKWDHYGYYETDKLKVGCTFENDTVFYTSYKFYFESTFEDAGEQYIKISEKMFSYGWSDWYAQAKNKYRDMQLHQTFEDEVANVLAEWDRPNILVYEEYEKPYNEKFLMGTSDLWIDGGDALSKTGENSISIIFELANESRINK